MTETRDNKAAAPGRVPVRVHETPDRGTPTSTTVPPRHRTRFARSARRGLTSLLAATVLVVTGAVLTTSPAQAARAINGPAGFSCDQSTATVAVAPPRVWATRGTEVVVWLSTLERWNPSTGQWYAYGNWSDQSTYNYYGQSLTSWGPKYYNNYMHYPVIHTGYYRVKSAVGGNQGGVQWIGYVPGGYCYIS